LPTPEPSSPENTPEKAQSPQILFSSSPHIVDLVLPDTPRKRNKSSRISRPLTNVPPLPWQSSLEKPPPTKTHNSEIQLTQISVPLSMEKWSQVTVPLTCEPLSQNSVVPLTSGPLPWQTSQDKLPPSGRPKNPKPKAKRQSKKRSSASMENQTEPAIQMQMPAMTMPPMNQFTPQGLFTQQPFMTMFPFGGCGNFGQNMNGQTFTMPAPNWGVVKRTKRPKAQQELCCVPFNAWAAKEDQNGRPPHQKGCRNSSSK
jgi:hypothetical protein